MATRPLKKEEAVAALSRRGGGDLGAFREGEAPTGERDEGGVDVDTVSEMRRTQGTDVETHG